MTRQLISHPPALPQERHIPRTHGACDMEQLRDGFFDGAGLREDMADGQLCLLQAVLLFTSADVLEHHDGADRPVTLTNGTGDVLDGKQRAVLSGEGFVLDTMYSPVVKRRAEAERVRRVHRISMPAR